MLFLDIGGFRSRSMAAASSDRWRPKRFAPCLAVVAKITQDEIVRVIRAAREVGAAEVIVDGEG